MACIMEIFSLPPDLVLEKATRKKVFFGEFFSLSKNLFLTVMVRAGSRLPLKFKDESVGAIKCSKTNFFCGNLTGNDPKNDRKSFNL